MSDEKIRKVLLLGSGGLKIGQAGEFDYSGSQAIKALKEENIEVILLNPNIATVQTDPGMADKVYLLPLNTATATEIIAKERPDGILVGFGGQTALNLGLDLEKKGVLKEYGVRVLGTSLESIRLTEDRESFRCALESISVKTAQSKQVYSWQEAREVARNIGYPVMIRRGFSLGGLGSGKVSSEEELELRAKEIFAVSDSLLIEEYLAGWKEIEYEIIRDVRGNGITVCNMENLDPVGVHTGESIVVCPSQTLTNREYHFLREIALKVAERFNIIGECNIQYSLNSETFDYRVIEVNARLSRSSALASKATGYPIAFVAAKLMLGYELPDLKNTVTKNTPAFFEPSLDYVVVKIPRWDTDKFRFVDRNIGTEMKSVGEVMAIGRNFPEALLKAFRMSRGKSGGFCDVTASLNASQDKINDEIAVPTDRRLAVIFNYFENGGHVEDVHRLSRIDMWFLSQIKLIADLANILKTEELTPILLKKAKQMGFSDYEIAFYQSTEEEVIRQRRLELNIRPCVKRIDTLAGEFNAQTNYLYLTYSGEEDDFISSSRESVIVIGSGPYSIGSSVEFDWCAVNVVRRLREKGIESVIVNSNPETVSTDYDESDRLYFEEITLERIRDIADIENYRGIILSVGGQLANNLAVPLETNGYRILGTSSDHIDLAENRRRFSALLTYLQVDQPDWVEVTSYEEAKCFADNVGYPLLIRPSYVLSGSAMNVVYDESSLDALLIKAVDVSGKHPVVISKFIAEGKEFEVDGVAYDGRVLLKAFSEHIEYAGVHSGDATIVLPPHNLSASILEEATLIMEKITKALMITGPFNIQFISKGEEIKVIECNARASRSFPFVSKVTGRNFAGLVVDVCLGEENICTYPDRVLNHIGIKMPLFSYHRLKGSNPVAYVEMASTGEIANLGKDFSKVLFSSWLSTDKSLNGKRILLSVGDSCKKKIFEEVRILHEKGWSFYATQGTHRFLADYGVPSLPLFKMNEQGLPNAYNLINERAVDLIINIPDPSPVKLGTAGYKIRRLAIDRDIPLITDLELAKAFLKCLSEDGYASSEIQCWHDYVGVDHD